MRIVVVILVGLLIVLMVVACQRAKKSKEPGKRPGEAEIDGRHEQPSQAKKSAGEPESFPWDRRDILVFYALDSENEEPRPGTNSLVMKDFLKLDKDNRVFITDGAPNISVTTMEDLRQTIEKRKAAGNLSYEILARLDQILNWMQRSGKEWVGFQAEPVEMAGDGTARAKGLKADWKK